MADSDIRPRVGFRALKPGLAARIEDRRAGAGQDHLLGDHFSFAGVRIKPGIAKTSLSILDRPVLGAPLLEAAVEDRDTLRAEVAEHEPAARSGPEWRIVIDDDAVVTADTEFGHGGAKVGFRGQHMRRRVGAVRNLVDVEEARPRNMRLEKLGTWIAA